MPKSERVEHREGIHQAFMTLATAIICWRRLERSICQGLLA
jgi:hypothetical protein